MTKSSDRRRAELDVLAAAWAVYNGGLPVQTDDWFALTRALLALRSLPLDEATRARAGGPLLTSQNAAAFVDGARAQSMIGRILQAVDARSGLTTEELCDVVRGKNGAPGKHQTISARVHELWRNGWLRTDSDRFTTSGQLASVWRITPEARAALAASRQAEIEDEWKRMADG